MAEPSRWPWILVTAGLFGLGALAAPIDLPLARWVLAGNCPRALHDLVDKVESFAHGIGVAIILLTLIVIDVRHRWAMPRVVLAVVSSGLAANVIKMLIARTRPREFDLDATWIETFGPWLPLFNEGNAGQSTPSAHTAAAVALAVALTWLYPRGRWIFAGLAMLAGCQRIETGAHFLSDVCWGAALGWFIAVGILQTRLTPAWFDRWERHKSRESDDSIIDRNIRNG